MFKITPFQIVVLSASSILLLLIFSAPPIRPIKAVREYSESQNCPASNPPGAYGTADIQKRYADDKNLILNEEIKKANDEIKMRIDQEDHWYDYKFLILGALLAAFVGKFVFGGLTPEIILETMLRSSATCSVLAIACVLAISIDIHVRHNMTITNQLGSWLTYYAEPTLLHSCLQTQAAQHPFLLWENFLRIDSGMQTDALYSISFWPHLHFLTWVIYVIYLITLQQAAQDPKTPLSSLTKVGFCLVHVSMFVFAWAAHTVPGTFEVLPLGTEGFKLSGLWVSLYFIPVAGLVLLNLPYVWRLSRKNRGSSEIPVETPTDCGLS